MIKVNTALVTVPVVVTDRYGQFVTGLSRNDFRLQENGEPQQITSFSSTEAPFNVALLIDTSRSTRNKLGAIRKAALNFIKQLQPNDRVLIVTFDEKVNFLGDFTSDRRELERAIRSIKSSYLTSLYDALHRTITEKLAPIKGRKAIVALTDGIDTWSRQATYESTLELVANTGVSSYAIQYDTRNDGGSPTSPLALPRLPGTTSSRASFRAPLKRGISRSATAIWSRRNICAPLPRNPARSISAPRALKAPLSPSPSLRMNCETSTHWRTIRPTINATAASE